MSGEEPDESQSEQTETTSSEEDATKSYTEPSFETLGSVAAIAGLMQGNHGKGRGKGKGKGKGKGRGNAPSNRI